MKKDYIAMMTITILLSLSNIMTCFVQASSLEGNQINTQPQIRADNNLNVTLSIFLSPNFTIFYREVTNTKVSLIITNLHELNNTIALSSILFYTTEKDITWDSSSDGKFVPIPKINFNLTKYEPPIQPSGYCKIFIPANFSGTSIMINGTMMSSGLIWRNVDEISPIRVKSNDDNYTLNVDYNLVIMFPSRSRVIKIFGDDKNVPQFGDRIVLLDIDPYSSFVVLYEPETWEAVALGIMLICIILIFIFPYIVAAFQKFLISKYKSLFSKAFSWIQLKISKISSRALIAFILCSIMMISISLFVGPDPRPKFFILSSTQQNASFLKDEVIALGGDAITIFQEMADFKALAQIGVFQAVIVGDYNPPFIQTVKNYIYPGLDLIPKIILVNITYTESYPFSVSSISQEIENRYSDKVVSIENIDFSFPIAFRSVKKRINILGLNLDSGIFLGFAGLVGLLSFALVFFGTMFLVQKILDVGKRLTIIGFGEVVAYATFYHVYSSAIIMNCSVLLGMPLALHASTPGVTALSIIGFGGGSYPRMFSSLAGFLLAVISSKQIVKIDRLAIAATLVIIFFLMIDPLTGGLIFYEFASFFSLAIEAFDYSRWTLLSSKSFVYIIAQTIGAGVSSIYWFSTGVAYYFAAAVSLFLLPKVEKGTKTLLFLFCAFFISWGGMRIGNLNPWDDFVSMTPGLILGFFFFVLFWSLSFIETNIRKRLWKIQ